MIMTFATRASREALRNLNIPPTVSGSVFRVVITPIEDEAPNIVSFRNLKGIAGCELTLDDVKKGRLCETTD